MERLCFKCFKKKITNLNEIKNLIITSEQSSTSLIEKSKFVVGLNSTCLIEARILKKPVVVPSIFEANSSLKSRIYFKKYFDKNLYAPKNKAEFFDITSKLCKSNSKKPSSSAWSANFPIVLGVRYSLTWSPLGEFVKQY